MGYQIEQTVETTTQFSRVASVLPQSKKIQKIPRSEESAKPKSRNGKKYKTFDSADKKSIISSLKRSLIDLKLTNHLRNNLSSSELVKALEALSVEDFNAVLNDALPEHVENWKSNVKNLRRWRRRIKEWINSSEKPETRGHLLIPREKLGLFKQHLIPEIQQMQSRNINILRQKLPSLFEKIDLPIKKKTCSKNWWYTFLDKNSEIKTLWESLPKRINMYDLSDQSRSDSDSPFDMDADFETGFLFLEQNQIIVEEEKINEEHFFFPSPPLEERVDLLMESEPSPNQEIEVENLIPGFLGISINPQAFQHEMVIEELQRWREWNDEDFLGEPLWRNVDQEPIQEIYRNHFFQEKEDIVSLLEAALEMEVTQSSQTAVSFM